MVNSFGKIKEDIEEIGKTASNMERGYTEDMINKINKGNGKME